MVFYQCVGVVISFMSPQWNPEQENLNKSLTRPLSVGVAELKQVAPAICKTVGSQVGSGLNGNLHKGL